MHLSVHTYPFWMNLIKVGKFSPRFLEILRIFIKFGKSAVSIEGCQKPPRPKSLKSNIKLRPVVVILRPGSLVG